VLMYSTADISNNSPHLGSSAFVHMGTRSSIAQTGGHGFAPGLGL
jgi:hypothetical protein